MPPAKIVVAYNGLDALTNVTDPRSLVTGYTVDGLGNLNVQTSPDTGTASLDFSSPRARMQALRMSGFLTFGGSLKMAIRAAGMPSPTGPRATCW